MILKGIITSATRSKDGHSQVRVTVPSFGEVIFSAPKAELVELLGAPDDRDVTVEVTWSRA
jgi:hypothetical protein